MTPDMSRGSGTVEAKEITRSLAVGSMEVVMAKGVKDQVFLSTTGVISREVASIDGIAR